VEEDQGYMDADDEYAGEESEVEDEEEFTGSNAEEFVDEDVDHLDAEDELVETYQTSHNSRGSRWPSPARRRASQKSPSRTGDRSSSPKSSPSKVGCVCRIMEHSHCIL
jgi:hypothetical protein